MIIELSCYSFHLCERPQLTGATKHCANEDDVLTITSLQNRHSKFKDIKPTFESETQEVLIHNIRYQEREITVFTRVIHAIA